MSGVKFQIISKPKIDTRHVVTFAYTLQLNIIKDQAKFKTIRFHRSQEESKIENGNCPCIMCVLNFKLSADRTSLHDRC